MDIEPMSMDFYTPPEYERRFMRENVVRRNRPSLLNPPMDRLAPYAGGEEQDVSIAGLLDIIGEHRGLFLGVLLAVLALGGAYIFGSPKKYGSTMELLVTNARSVPAISTGKTESTGAVQEVTEEQLNSEAEVLRSTDVLNAVVDPTWSSQTQRSADEQARHEKGLNALRKELQVNPVRKSYLLSVQINTTDPYQSTQLLTKLLTSFLDEKRRLIQPPGLWQMFSQQAEQYKQQWQDAQGQLSEFQREQGLVSIADQEDLLQKQILAINTELASSNAELAFTRDKIHGDVSQVNLTPKRMVTRTTEIPDTGSVDQLHKQLNDLEQRRTELLTKYRSDDRLVQQVDSQIRQVNGALDQTLGFRSSETSSDVNPTWQYAQQDLSENSAKVAALTGRRKELQQELDDLNQKLDSTEQKAGAYNALQHRVAELDQNYQLYLQKRDEAQMAEVMNEHQVLNVAVAQMPTFSTTPVSPKPLRDGVLTVATGLLLASFTVFMVHNSRRPADRDRVVLNLEPVKSYRRLVFVPSRPDAMDDPSPPLEGNARS
jgi:uncharacterized protein involved in exopolysaccharide biosynthesis